MRILIVLSGVAFLLLLAWLYKIFSHKIEFYSVGLDSKFTWSEISMLWKLGKDTTMNEPLSLFFSVKALSNCISQIIEAARKDGTENTPQVQYFLEKLYKLRTKIELATDRKRGIESSRTLDNNQKIRIVLKGSGLFASKIINNGSEITVSLPVQDGKVKLQPKKWEGKNISVYLWRKGDAGYVFDTKVVRTGLFYGMPVLFLQHSKNILRVQKRKSFRSECHIAAQLYIIKSKVTDYSTVETAPGYQCLIEDISSDGALVRIGGKGIANIQMKIQFELEGTLIIMYTVVRSVEYNATNNQSRLHLECIHLESAMRNAILSYVYKIIPEEEKNTEVALNELEKEDEDSQQDDEKEENAPPPENVDALAPPEDVEAALNDTKKVESDAEKSDEEKAKAEESKTGKDDADKSDAEKVEAEESKSGETGETDAE